MVEPSTIAASAPDAAESADAADTPTSGVQVFSAPSDAPRVRLRIDLISAGTAAALLAFLILVAGEGSSFDDNTLRFVGGLPGWLQWSGQAAYSVAVVYSLGLLLGVGLLARGRLELLRDLVMAAAVAVVLSSLLTWWLDERWPQVAFFDLQVTRETFPAFFAATATAIQAAAAPHLTAPMRRIGWWFILTGTVAAVFGPVTTVSDATGAVLVGLISAALVRFAFGTSAGLPSTNRVRAGLADLGVHVDALRYEDEQPVAAIALRATSPDGAPWHVTGVGRDAWSTRRWARLWRAAWYQDQGSQQGSDRRQQVEHEALVMLLARQRGVSVPGLVTVGMSADDDALLVTDLVDHTLDDLAADDVDDATLDAVWAELGRMHAAGLSHGSIDGAHVGFDASGRPVLWGFGDAVVVPSDQQVHDDVAALLVLTALVTGDDRAIAAARRSCSDDDLTAMLPVLQQAALSPRLRSRVRRQKLSLKQLRKDVAATLDTDLPELEQLTRVTWTSALMVVFVGFAALTIVNGLAEVGFATIGTTLSDARWGLVAIGLVLAAATNWTDAVALRAVSVKPVPVGVTTVEQFAVGFVNIAVPSAAGRVATNARYFQKFGISPVTSTMTGAITGMLGFIAQAILVAVTILAGSGSIDLSGLQGGGGALRILVLAVALFVAAFLVMLAVPRWRRWAADKVRRPLSQIGDALRTLWNPRVAATALGASLGSEVLYGAGFAVCVLSVGGSISLGEAIFINVAVSLFAGLMPVPGGVGVTEAGMTAGLTAVGVDGGVAISGVLVYRMVSYYLPPLWGYVSLRWLTRHDYL